MLSEILRPEYNRLPQTWTRCPLHEIPTTVTPRFETHSTDEDVAHARRATAPSGVFQARDDAIGLLNPAGDGQSEDGLDESGGNSNHDRSTGGVGEGAGVDGEEAGDGAVDSNLEGGGPEGEEKEEEKEEEELEEEEEEREPPFEKGSFFFKVDDKDKGHYRVRDVSCFLLTSMYKRKDRVTRTPGVSLLVGKLEDPPHEEKVISALFDTDRFTERAAAQWWEDNGHRFEDARSLAAKKVTEEGKQHLELMPTTVVVEHKFAVYGTRQTNKLVELFFPPYIPAAET